MNVGKKLYDRDYEQIILRDAYGKTAREIEAELQISNSSVSSVTRAFKAVRDKRWDIIKDMIRKGATNLVFLNWASDKLGVQIPEDVAEVYYEKYPNKRPYKKPEPVPVKEAEEQITIEEVTEKENESRFFMTTIKHLQQLNATLTLVFKALSGIANSTANVLTNVRYIKENNAKNTDIICGQLQQLNTRVETIEKALK